MRTNLIFCVFTLVFCQQTIAGELADKQRRQIENTLEAHQKSVNGVVNEIVDQPKSAREQACLDDLMGVDMSGFVVDASGMWSKLLDQLTAQMMAMACDATSDSWNDAVQAAEGEMTMPYDLGGVTISSTNNSADWGVASSADLEMPESEVETFTYSIDELGNVDTSAPDPDVSGLGASIEPPSWGTTNEQLGDNMQSAFEDMFF